MGRCKPIDTLEDSTKRLCKMRYEHNPNSDLLDSSVPHAEAVGSLIYLAVATRPDIAHAVNQLTQYISDSSL